LGGGGATDTLDDEEHEGRLDPHGTETGDQIVLVCNPSRAQHATLLGFANAYRDEMGITNDLYPEEIGTDLTPEQLAACDTVPNPEDKRDPMTHLRDIDNLANFMRFLAPIEPLPQTGNLRRGAELFASAQVSLLQIAQFMAQA
jgi:hypothetical protein